MRTLIIEDMLRGNAPVAKSESGSGIEDSEQLFADPAGYSEIAVAGRLVILQPPLACYANESDSLLRLCA